MFKAGENAVRAELPGHDTGKSGENNPDPEHIGEIACCIDVQVHSGETRQERHIQLVCSIQVDSKREIDDHYVDDRRIRPLPLQLR